MIDTLTKNLIEIAIAEDLGDGDHSSLSCIPVEQKNHAHLLVKQSGVIAGLNVADYVCKRIDPEIEITYFKKDGDDIEHGDIAFKIYGNSQKLLQSERLVLNFLQRMSGIATTTRNYVEAVSGTKAKILDTRKTTPGLRAIEKMAVQIGGGFNHRHGLYDRIMLKDNHIDFAGSIAKAIEQVVVYLTKHQKQIPIEVETRNFKEIEAALKTGKVDRIMLDNFSLENTAKAVQYIGNSSEIESSGGINLENVRDYALCGVGFISVGALTHQIKSLDLSLKGV